MLFVSFYPITFSPLSSFRVSQTLSCHWGPPRGRRGLQVRLSAFGGLKNGCANPPMTRRVADVSLMTPRVRAFHVPSTDHIENMGRPGAVVGTRGPPGSRGRREGTAREPR